MQLMFTSLGKRERCPVCGVEGSYAFMIVKEHREMVFCEECAINAIVENASPMRAKRCDVIS